MIKYKNICFENELHAPVFCELLSWNGEEFF